MLLHDLVPVIQLSVSPVIVISGVGLVLLSMTNRYGRVIDNARHLLDKMRDADGPTKAHLFSQIQILYRRCRHLRTAITLSTISLLLMALLIVLLFIFSFFQMELILLLVILFIVSMSALSASLIYFLIDINTSLNALAIELRMQQPKAS
ncbi:MAG TPA: DUF2721 domain-containing protein [Candidatus Methylacidiphilales bacterium]